MNEIYGLRRRTWAEIDLGAIRRNFSAVRAAVSPQTKVCCVIKADAYGHGAIRLARFYQTLGADWLAVSNLEEALQLRTNGITLPLLILGYTPEECVPLLAEYNISQTVYSYEYGMKLAELAEKAGVRLRIHIKLDTGMGRIGFAGREGDTAPWDQAREICQQSSLVAEGIFTHCATADQGEAGDPFTLRQFQLFMQGVSYLEKEGIHFEIRHFSNSAAMLEHPEYQLDMVRAGLVLYGLRPSHRVRRIPSLEPAMSWKTVISHCKSILPGESVSYGRTFRAERPMEIATVPVGYADGFWRQNQMTDGYLTVKGRKARIVGRICMDQLMIDVTDVDCKPGDVVTIFGKEGRDAEDLADANGTISYEILCSIGTRVPRFYVENGTVLGCQDCVYSEDLTK